MYFFDFFDGASDQVDVVGTRYRDEEAAIQAARIMLSDRALLEVLKGGEVVATVRVRRNTTPIFSATFSLTEEHYRLDS
jgi:hypothetical protein